MLDLSSVVKTQGAQIEFNENLQLSDLELSGQQFVFTTPLNISGKIVNSGSVLELTGKASGNVRTACARCTKEFDAPFCVDLDETLAQQTESTQASHEDIILFSGYSVSLSEIAANSILTNMPLRFLCDEDCKGLCKLCGQDLNQAQCDCSEDSVDPRFEVLAQLLKKK